MSYGIYRISDNTWFTGWLEDVVPKFSGHKDEALQYTSHSLANADEASLEDDFHFAVVVVNLEDGKF